MGVAVGDGRIVAVPDQPADGIICVGDIPLCRAGSHDTVVHFSDQPPSRIYHLTEDLHICMTVGDRRVFCVSDQAPGIRVPSGDRSRYGAVLNDDSLAVQAPDQPPDIPLGGDRGLLQGDVGDHGPVLDHPEEPDVPVIGPVDIEVPDHMPLAVIRPSEPFAHESDRDEITSRRALDVGGLDVIGIERPPVRPGADLAEVRVGADVIRPRLVDGDEVGHRLGIAPVGVRDRQGDCVGAGHGVGVTRVLLG